MRDFYVRLGADSPLAFASPIRVLRAAGASAVPRALADAERALDDGYWVAGYTGYDRGAPLALGVFAEPERNEAANEARPTRISPLSPTIGRDAYDTALARIAEALYEGQVYQVNYTVPFAFAFEGDPLDAYCRLAASSGASYCAYIKDGSQAILSLSPELFLAFDARRITTKPMKGTATRESRAELGSPKNRAEHVMIVDLLRNDLHRVCDDVHVEHLFSHEMYPTFATTTSTVSGTLRAGATLPDIWHAIFPCGSVTGAPKESAMQIIARVEAAPRGIYCGSIGYLSPQRRGWWNVAIRTAQFDCSTGIGRYDAGGGIVADSTAPQEWSELLLKTQAFRDAIAPFDILETFASGDDTTCDLHVARMRATARQLCVPFDETRVFAALQSLDCDGVIRVRLRADGAVHATAAPRDTPPEPVSVCFTDERVHSRDPMLAFKTSWRPVHERAALQANALGCFDALLCNERNELTEGARTTLFAQFGDALVTPPLRCGLLPGILRARLVETGQARERVLTPESLARADAVFVGNSARGLLRARLIGS